MARLPPPPPAPPPPPPPFPPPPCAFLCCPVTDIVKDRVGRTGDLGRPLFSSYPDVRWKTTLVLAKSEAYLQHVVHMVMDLRKSSIWYCSVKFSAASRPQRPWGLLETSQEPRTATSTFTQLLSSGSASLRVEMGRLLGLIGTSREPRTATSTLHSSLALALWCSKRFFKSRDGKTPRIVRDVPGAQDGHLDFHTAPELWRCGA